MGANDSSRFKMNKLLDGPITPLLAAIEQAGVPGLRVAFTMAVLLFLSGGVFIFRRRHQFFDRDPNVSNDVPEVRHNRLEVVLFVWGGITTVLIFILVQVWSA